MGMVNIKNRTIKRLRKWAQLDDPRVKRFEDLADYLSKFSKNRQVCVPRIWGGIDLRESLEFAHIQIRVYADYYEVTGVPRDHWRDLRGNTYGDLVLVRHLTPDRCLLKCKCGRCITLNRGSVLQVVSCGFCGKCRYGTSRAKHAWLRRKADTQGYLLELVRKKAKSTGVGCYLKKEDIVVPEICPVTFTPLGSSRRQRNGSSPTVVRLDNGEDYTPDNIAVLSCEGASILAGDRHITEAEMTYQGIRMGGVGVTPEDLFIQMESLKIASRAGQLRDYPDLVDFVEGRSDGVSSRTTR